MDKNILDMIDKVLEKGYLVLYSEGKTYFHFSDGKAIGYFQYDNNVKEHWAVTHKPSKDNGSGFMVDNIEEALTQPHFKYSNIAITYYKDIDEFIQNYWDKTAKILEGKNNVSTMD